MLRLRRELSDLAGYWALPLLVALLPYRAGIALARLVARTFPLYDAAAQAGLVEVRAVCGGDGQRWLADFRFAQLIDRADLSGRSPSPPLPAFADGRLPARWTVAPCWS
jgi:hypothetical protein